MSAEEYATIKDVMAELGVSEATAWKLIKAEEIERFRFHGRRETLIKRSELERLQQPISLDAPQRGRPRGSTQPKKVAA